MPQLSKWEQLCEQIADKAKRPFMPNVSPFSKPIYSLCVNQAWSPNYRSLGLACAYGGAYLSVGNMQSYGYTELYNFLHSDLSQWIDYIDERYPVAPMEGKPNKLTQLFAECEEVKEFYTASFSGMSYREALCHFCERETLNKFSDLFDCFNEETQATPARSWDIQPDHFITILWKEVNQ